MAPNLAVAITIFVLDNDDTAIGAMAVLHPPIELRKIMASHLLLVITGAVVFGFNDHNAAVGTMTMPLASVELREIMPSSTTRMLRSPLAMPSSSSAQPRIRHAFRNETSAAAPTVACNAWLDDESPATLSSAAAGGRCLP